MRPQPAARIDGTAARTSRIDVSRFASTAARIASSSTSSARAGGGPPALATRMSRPPKRSRVASTSRRGLRRVRHVARQRERGAGQCVGDRAQAIGVARVHRDVASLRGEGARGAETEPLRGRRDERGLAPDPKVHGAHATRPDASRCRRPSAPTRLGRHAAGREEAADHRRAHAAVDRVRRRALRAGARRRDRADELRADREPHAEDGEAAARAVRRPRVGRERPRPDRRGSCGAGVAVGSRRRGARTRSRSRPRTRWAGTSCTPRGRRSRPRSRPARSPSRRSPSGCSP